MNVLIGYGYHPVTAGSYIERALARRATTTFVGMAGGDRAGFAPTGDLGSLARNLSQQPDLYLYVDSGEPGYLPRGLTQLDVPTACYLIDVHLRSRELLKKALLFDYAFSAQCDFVAVLRAAGHPQAHWLPLACDPQVHRRYDVPKRYDIGFVGSVRSGYERRRVLVERLARRFTINDYSQPHTPAEMARLHSESRLVFNCSMRHEVNMRLFEAPATGSLLLTDRIGNGLDALVTDREHVVMYDDDRLVDLADEYLRDEAARERIARQGYEHVRAHHTYLHRVDTILDTVFAATLRPRLDAPLRQCSDVDVELAYAELYSMMGQVDETIDQYRRTPRRWRYRAPAAKQLALCLLRRAHYLTQV